MKRSLKVILSMSLIMAFIATSLGLTAIAVKSIKLSTSSVNISIGKTYKLKVTITPENATNKKLTFSSANKKIASVDKNGYIKGIIPGKTVVTVKSVSNKKAMAKCNVTITNAKPVVLTMWTGGGTYKKQGIQDDNPVAKEITKKTGAILNLDSPVANYRDKFVAALASNDLPDIAYVWADAQIYPKVITADVAMDLEPYIDTYFTALKSEQPQVIEWGRRNSVDISGKNDEKLRFIFLEIGLSGDNLQPGISPYIRFDLWKQLGYPKIETTDDLMDVLIQMQKLEPTNLEGKKNYISALWGGDAPGWGMWNLSQAFGLTEGQLGIACGYICYDLETYQLADRYSDSGPFIKTLKWYNKAYRLGVLDPDSFVQKWTNYSEKATANRYFVHFASWMTGGGNSTFIKNGTPEKGYFPIPCPTASKKVNHYMTQPNGYRPFIINKNTKHPEVACKVLDFFVSYEGNELLYNGIKGVDWKEVNGKPVPSSKVIDGFKNDPDFSKNTGIQLYNSGLSQSTINPKYNIPINYRQQEDVLKNNLTEIQKIGCKYFDITLPIGILKKFKEVYTTDITFNTDLYANTPEDIMSIMGKIDDYVFLNSLKVVSSKSEEEFNSALQKYKNDIKALDPDKKAYNYYYNKAADLRKAMKIK